MTSALESVAMPKVRLAVISPFVDTQHGTERVLAEQLMRLRSEPDWEIRLYSQSVRDLAVSPMHERRETPSGSIAWRRVPVLPGPHLVQFIFWFSANTVVRYWDRRFRRVKYDLLFSPGINAFDADAVAVHIVFHEFYRQAAGQLGFRGAPMRSWPRRLHRLLYYRCIMALESRIYRNSKICLTAVSGLVADQLRSHFGRTDVRVIPNGVETKEFNAANWNGRRDRARTEFGLAKNDFVLLLLGNDWVKKGLPNLLAALALLENRSIRLIVAGRDDHRLFLAELQNLDLEDLVRFSAPRTDVIHFYAAADTYVGPSLEDAFGLPIIEAMACGLPVIASVRAGASEAIHHGVNGLLLQNPNDPRELARHIAELHGDPSLRQRLGKAAEISAQDYSWEKNAKQLKDFLLNAARQKSSRRKEPA
jgi:glycosyltransferase involved in cell wall biosynthesis